jgi:hypothetical protein
MDQPPAPDSTAWPFPFPPQDWEQTPPAVQAYLRTVQQDLVLFHDLREHAQHCTSVTRRTILPAGLALWRGWGVAPSGAGWSLAGVYA